MAPDADCETARLNGEYVGTHQGRRVLPEQAARAPARAWAESEEVGERSPGESRRLLPAAPPHKHKSRLQAGLTLGVHTDYPQKPTPSYDYQKARFQKRKEKLIQILKPPYFILSIIVVMVCIHAFGAPALGSRLEWSPTAWRRQPWRMLTYGVMHASTAHLALNAIVALIVGWGLEREQGWWRVMCVWWGGVAAGALGAAALQPHVKVVGASAAVYALLTAHLPNVCIKFGHISLWWFRPLSVVVLMVSEGCWALARTPPTPLAYAHVAWAAHVLGAAVGVPLAFVVFTGENNGKRYIIVARVISGLLLVTAVAFAIYHYAFGDDT